MKKRVLGIFIVSALIFSGCSGKAASGTNSNSPVSNANSTNSSSTAASPANVNYKPLNPGTIPQLSSQQKTQVNSKLNSAVTNVNNALKSLQDPNNIDLN